MEGGVGIGAVIEVGIEGGVVIGAVIGAVNWS